MVKVTKEDDCVARMIFEKFNGRSFMMEGSHPLPRWVAEYREICQAPLIEALENIQKEANRENRLMQHLLKCISHQVGTALSKVEGE